MAILILKLALPLFLLISCSGDGSDPGPVKLPEVPEPPATVNDQPALPADTGVNFKLYGVAPELKKNCRTAEGPRELLGEGLKIDGDFSDWDEIGQETIDTAGDSHGPLDIHAVTVAREGEKAFFHIRAEGELGAGQYLFLEFYKGVKKGSVALELEHVIRLRADSAEIFHTDRWLPLPAPFVYEAAFGSEGVELSLSIEHFLGGVVDSPLWGLQVSFGEVGRWYDYAAAAYFQGAVAGGYGQFGIGMCAEDPFSALPMKYQEVTTSGIGSGISIIRFAEEKVGGVLRDYLFPMAQIPIFATASGINATIAEKNLAAGSLGTLVETLAFIITGDDSKFGISKTGGFSFDPDPIISGFEDAVHRYLDLYFIGQGQDIDSYLKGLMVETIASSIIRQTSGEEIWFEYIMRTAIWQRRLGILMADEYHLGDVLDAWHRAREDPDKFWLALARAVPDLGEKTAVFREIFKLSAERQKAREAAEEKAKAEDDGAVIDTGPLIEVLDPRLVDGFADLDYDGLPHFFEIKAGLNPQSNDTDGDAWSDLAEIVSETDPKNLSSHPDILFPDGIFGDLIDLMPGRVAIDGEDPLGSCEGVGNIQTMIAVVDDKKLLVALQHAGAVERTEPMPIRWDIDISIPDQDHVSRIRAIRGETGFDLINAEGNKVLRYANPIPAGMEALEVAVTLGHLGIEKPDPSFRVKVTVTQNNEEGRFCDDTDWISPVVRRGGE